MKKNLLVITSLLFLIFAGVAQAGYIDCSGLPKTHTVTVNVKLASDGSSVVTGAATTERAGTSDSNYYYNFTGETAGITYVVECIDGTDANNNFSWTLTSRETYVDAAITSRGTSTYAGEAVASVTGNVGGNVTGSVGSVVGGVTVTTNNDKTGYTASTVSDKTGYTATCSTVSDKTGYSLTQTFPTNFADLAITASTGRVTVGTNADKTGYTVSTVSDKTGYSLSSPQTFNLTGDITGNLSGSVGSVTGGALQASVDDLEGRLTATRAGYLDNLSGGAVALASSALTAANVWDYNVSAYIDAGKAGTYLKSAASAGDPWSTSLPGVYGSGTAGYIVGTNLNATVGSRLPTSSYTAPDNTNIGNIWTETQTHPTLVEIEGSTVIAKQTSVDDLEGRLTATRAGYLDNLSGGAVALNSTVAKEATLANATYGLSALKDLIDAIDTSTELQARFTEIKGASWTTETLKVIKDTLASGVTVSSNTDKTGYALSAVGVDAIHDEIIEGTLTARQLSRVLLAVLAGKSSGGGTTTILFKGKDGTTTRVTAYVDSNGNRTSVTINGE